MAEKEFTCPVAGTLSMIGGKYKSIILNFISNFRLSA